MYNHTVINIENTGGGGGGGACKAAIAGSQSLSTSAVIINICDVFIETKYFLFLAVLEKEFLKILSWCKRRSPVIIPRKQFIYQESNCRGTVRSSDCIAGNASSRCCHFSAIVGIVVA